jgi:hypothetical protein
MLGQVEIVEVGFKFEVENEYEKVHARKLKPKHGLN